jgi:aspartyl protease family protein
MQQTMFRLLSLAFGFVVAMAVVAQVLTGSIGRFSSRPLLQTAQADNKKPTVASVEDLEVGRDATGKFHLGATVNGQDAQFILDTGADVVALNIEDAERLGVTIDRAAFKPIVQTASGTGLGAHVQIDRIEVAGQEFLDVDAVVIDGLKDNLLGQSLLRRFGRVEIQADKLIIRRS